MNNIIASIKVYNNYFDVNNEYKDLRLYEPEYNTFDISMHYRTSKNGDITTDKNFFGTNLSLVIDDNIIPLENYSRIKTNDLKDVKELNIIYHDYSNSLFMSQLPDLYHDKLVLVPHDDFRSLWLVGDFIQ